MSRNQITKAEPLAVSLSREHDTTPVTAGDRLAAWLRGLSPNTARAYTRDLEHFAKHLGETSPGAALDRLCSIPRARAIGLVEAYRQAGVDANLSSATVNRRLAAINSALREIAKADIGPGRLDVKGLKAEPVRETRGPSVSAIARVLEALGARTDARSIRDRAITSSSLRPSAGFAGRKSRP